MNRTVTIDEDNPFVYTTGEDIVKKIENKETFYLYVGDTQCPWCRSVIEMAIKKAKEFGVSKIYYIPIWDEDHNEVFRDKYELNEDGTLNRTIEGTEGYNKLLTLFKDVLSDYTLTKEDGSKVETGEKRIYAPNVVAVIDGKAYKMSEGISKDLKDPYSKLTDKMKKYSYNQFKCLLKCVNESKNVCTKKDVC